MQLNGRISRALRASQRGLSGESWRWRSGRERMRGRVAGMGVVAAGVFLVVTASAPLGAGATQGTPEHKITLCHATDSRSNPYVEVTVDVASVQFQGHAGHDGPIFSPDLPEHTKWGDIIPPFDFGDAGSYPGKNWTAEGQAIFDDGCNVPSPTTTTVAPTTTTVAPTSTTVAPTTTTAAPTTTSTTDEPTTTSTTEAPTTTTKPETSTTVAQQTTTSVDPSTTSTTIGDETSTTVGEATSTTVPTTETTEGGASSTTAAASSTTVGAGGPVTTQAIGPTTTTQPGASGALPFTGSDTTRLAFAGLTLIGAGIGMLVRRRRPRAV
jgi:hypothetical protein